MARCTSKALLSWLAFVCLCWGTGAQAASPSSDDDTMMVVQEGAVPDDIVNVIQLPPRASPTARDNVQRGSATSDAAVQSGESFGQQIADEAKAKNAGEQIRDDIRQNQRRDARGDNGPDPRANGR